MKKIRIIILFSIIFLFSVLIIFKKSILTSIIQIKFNQFNSRYHAKLSVENIDLKGFTKIYFKNICLLPDQGDTLIKINSINATINIWKLILFKMELKKLEVNSIDIHLVRHGDKTNYMFLINRKNRELIAKKDSVSEINFVDRFESIINRLFTAIPPTFIIENFNLSANMNEQKITFFTKNLTFTDKTFSAVFDMQEDKKTTHWIMNGILDGKNTEAQFKIFASEHQKIVIPYIKQKWNTQLYFDTINFKFKTHSTNHSFLTLNGSIVLNNLMINHPRIGNEDIIFNKATIQYKLNIAENSIELDSLSSFEFNKIKFNPYFKYCVTPSKQISLSFNKPRFNAQEFFESLPAGLFKNLEGIKTKGELGYHIKFFVDLSVPDSLLFESDLKSYTFRIVHPGNTDFTYINNPFTYTAYEKGQAIRSFDVGPSNPDFRPIEKIPDILKNSIMTSEDGAFYYHRGFLIEAFRESIVINIKEKRFARGGSTISMQLVKNLFLSRNKTILRKIEEALIVWLIENNGLSTKDRMYEIYLNIIEMGPGIYGVNEAARFYFNKDVSKLTLSECLYLASIVPHPKYFKYSFDAHGQLRDHLVAYFKFVSEKMLRKKQITQDDFDRLNKNLELKGPAKKFVIPVDSLPKDSIESEY